MKISEKVINFCKERGIPISSLEKSCGFSNGYIAGLRKDSIPIDRYLLICGFLGLPFDYFLDEIIIEVNKSFPATKDNPISKYVLGERADKQLEFQVTHYYPVSNFTGDTLEVALAYEKANERSREDAKFALRDYLAKPIEVKGDMAG